MGRETMPRHLSGAREDETLRRLKAGRRVCCHEHVEEYFPLVDRYGRYRTRPTAPRPSAERAACRYDDLAFRPASDGKCYRLDALLMVVRAQHEIALRRSKCRQCFAVVGDTETLRELAAHWIVVHDDCTQVARENSTKLIVAPSELRVGDCSNDCEITQSRRQRVRRDAVRRVEPDERRPWNAEHRL